MWIVFALLSALFAGITSILAKCGIKQTKSTVATALRTVVVLVCAWCMVFIAGSIQSIRNISANTWVFLILSGLTAALSWMFYFAALRLGDVNKVVPIDKSSIVLTLILFMFLGEVPTAFKCIGIVLIGIGTFLMIAKKCVADTQEQKTRRIWIISALLSAACASLTAVFGKIGIDGVQSDLGTAIRTSVIFVTVWLTVLFSPARKEVCRVDKKELFFIALSGVATGASWLCYFKALQTGIATAVTSIDKLSILVTILFSYIVFKEKLSVKAAMGLVLIVAGTVAMLF